MNRYTLLFVLAGLLSLHGAVFANASEPAKTFTYSTDSTHVVLFVAVMVPQSGTNRSITLYGDGRLDVAHFGTGRKVFKEKTFHLDPDEVKELLQIAADHDLPLWDVTAIHARQLRGKTKSSRTVVADGGIALVNVSLESFTKGESTHTDVYTKIRVTAPKSKAHFYPDMPEFRGVVLLMDQLYAFWRKAGWQLW